MNNAPDRIWAASATENYGEWQTTTDGLPRPTAYIRADLYAAIEAQFAALPEPDMVSMSEGTIHLDYEDDNARREAYEWLERYAYSSAPEAQQEPPQAAMEAKE